MKEKVPYKPTLFDRYGPDAGGYVRAAAYGLVVFGVSLPGGFLVLVKSGTPVTILTLAGIVLIAAIFGAAVAGLSIYLSEAAGSTYKALMVNGSSTPYKEQYSYQQALVMQGRLDEALESFEAVIAEQPDAVDPRLKAAELYARQKGDSARAAELFRQVQRIPTVTVGDDIYATNRLIDLLNGPLSDPGRALVELRRMIEKYPGSAAADHARDALAALKPAHVPPND